MATLTKRFSGPTTKSPIAPLGLILQFTDLLPFTWLGRSRKAEAG